MPSRALAFALVVQCLASLGSNAAAQVRKDYRCTIERVAMPQQTSAKMVEAQEKQYLGRVFTVERRTGIMAGALKNAYLTKPSVIDMGSSENSYKVVTTLRLEEGVGRGTNVYALVVNEYFRGESKPFVFLENEEVFFGTCVHF
jgi:glycerol-3-phosphate dehydrogenase